MDLVILDIGLPDMEGHEVLEQLRQWSQVPVIMLTVRAGEAEKVRALDTGANDYVTKPFGTQELMARVRALLRTRSVPSDGTPPVGAGWRAGGADPQGVRAAVAAAAQRRAGGDPAADPAGDLGPDPSARPPLPAHPGRQAAAQAGRFGTGFALPVHRTGRGPAVQGVVPAAGRQPHQPSAGTCSCRPAAGTTALDGTCRVHPNRRAAQISSAINSAMTSSGSSSPKYTPGIMPLICAFTSRSTPRVCSSSSTCMVNASRTTLGSRPSVPALSTSVSSTMPRSRPSRTLPITQPVPRANGPLPRRSRPGSGCSLR
ncbi:hypothetical protein G6F59_013530 [Rhizopus arrhizus]|nr:hypothetical protein G6F59_013530 [Rhizopus arrhizus]